MLSVMTTETLGTHQKEWSVHRPSTADADLLAKCCCITVADEDGGSVKLFVSHDLAKKLRDDLSRIYGRRPEPASEAVSPTAPR